MKRRLAVIGIGAGNPDHVTVQAVKAMNRVDVFFIPNKGGEKQELARIREEILGRHVSNSSFRSVVFDLPLRGMGTDYDASVMKWHQDVEAVYGELIAEELTPSQTGAFLVWGDPTLYDSTIRILDRLKARGDFELEYEVFPGISSVQALAAEHKVTLNEIGHSILITSGRDLAASFPDNADSVVVLLNAEKALRQADTGSDVFWGAYLGTPDQILVAGKLGDVVDDIERIRAEARRKKGWIMDIALMKRRRRGESL
ncbi:precorrin-6A synthase (deacetylating) [Labrys sp. WJW]|uniref:precorrin-6A synthase (deacetylating) n=1 Tax=Labrys sp. WJW TaxID=1737983 RepID=UPI0008360C32|nr:precorrin-6A synthase (deacetylating) [Labrys sp. WJW]OCC05481.1 precorrin-6A synthase (deacetylating) [Labrys sp. WJW]